MRKGLSEMIFTLTQVKLLKKGSSALNLTTLLAAKILIGSVSLLLLTAQGLSQSPEPGFTTERLRESTIRLDEFLLLSSSDWIECKNQSCSVLFEKLLSDSMRARLRKLREKRLAEDYDSFRSKANEQRKKVKEVFKHSCATVIKTTFLHSGADHLNICSDLFEGLIAQPGHQLMYGKIQKEENIRTTHIRLRTDHQAEFSNHLVHELSVLRNREDAAAAKRAKGPGADEEKSEEPVRKRVTREAVAAALPLSKALAILKDSIDSNQPPTPIAPSPSPPAVGTPD